MGIEIVDNPVKDSYANKCINKKENIEFISSNTKKVIDKISQDYDSIIVILSRSGVDKYVLKK